MELPRLPDSLAESFAGLVRSHRKRARTRAQIIHAAVELIGTEGISAILVSDVAERANVTSGTVYNHFASKEALLVAVAEALSTCLCRELDAAAIGAPIAASLASYYLLWMALAAQQPAWASCIAELSIGRVDHCMKSLSRDVARRIRRGARAGVFSVGSRAAATDLVVGTLVMALRNLVRGKIDAERCAGTAAMLLQALGVSARDAGAAVEFAQGRRGS